MAPRGHSADDVARTALRILDDHGLPDLTMRRLATALEVQPSALYWHYPNKQTLLAELSDRIVQRMASGTGTDLRTEAHALRDALLTYRDGAEVVSSTLALGLGAPLAHDRLTAAVVADGFDVETASRAATTVLHYVLGFAWHEQQRVQYDSVGVRGGGAGTADAGPVGDTSAGETGAGDADAVGDDPVGLATDDFAFGLDLIAAGLRARGRV